MMATELKANSDTVRPAVVSKGILDLCKVAQAPDGLPLLQIYQEDMVKPGSPDKELGFEFTLTTTSFSGGSLDEQLFGFQQAMRRPTKTWQTCGLWASASRFRSSEHPNRFLFGWTYSSTGFFEGLQRARQGRIPREESCRVRACMWSP